MCFASCIFKLNILKSKLIMKTLIQLCSFVFIAFFISCSGDDNENQSANNLGSLTLGDQTIKLSQAYLENYGKIGDSYNIDFSARSEILSGTGEASAVVYFELFSSSEKKLAIGDYVLGDYSSAAANTFTQWGESILGVNITSTDKGLMVANGVSIKPTEGVFTVTENGSNYKVSFTGKGTASYYTNSKLTSTQDNIDFSMEYNGTVNKYNSTEFTGKRVKTKERIDKVHTVLLN